MPDAGPWTAADVGAAGTRPGFYVNFQAIAQASILAGERGIVGIISEADWGSPNAIVELESVTEAVEAYTDLEDATSRLYNLARFAFRGGAREVKAVRVLNTSNAVKATLTLNDDLAAGVLRIDAKYVGTYGNNISVVVGDDPVDGTKTRIRIFVEDGLVHSVTTTVNSGVAGFIDDVVALFAALESVWVDIVKLGDGDNTLADLADTNLASGANGDAVTSTEFTAALALFAANEIHILTSDTVTAAIHTVMAQWVADRRDEGYRVIAVLGSDTGDTATTIITDSQSFNTEAVVYVGGGAVMPSADSVATTYKGSAIASVVAGIIAGIPASNSPSFKALPGSTNVETNFTSAQVSSMLAAGALVITPSPNGNARIEKGITTLYNPIGSQLSAFKSIRILRITDGIADSLGTAMSSTVIGSQLSDEPGRSALIDAVKDFLNTQVEQRNIRPGYTAEIDEDADNSGSKVFVKIGITPIDSVETIFATITMN